jgi:hypothetical protein
MGRFNQGVPGMRQETPGAQTQAQAAPAGGRPAGAH